MRFNCKRTDVGAWTSHDDYSGGSDSHYDMFDYCTECAIDYTEGLADRDVNNDGDNVYVRGIRCTACKPDVAEGASGSGSPAEEYHLVRDRCYEKAELSSVCYSA